MAAAFLRIFFAVLLAAMIAPQARAASDSVLAEYQAKAERITAFPRFIEWPTRSFTTADAPFVIGIAGTDYLTGILREIIQDRRIKERPVVIRRVMAKQELTGCHMLFISNSERERLDTILREVRKEGILTIGESENFLDRGGVINLVKMGSTIRFQINPEAAARERLKVSSKLLSIALPPSFDPNDPEKAMMATQFAGPAIGSR